MAKLVPELGRSVGRSFGGRLLIHPPITLSEKALQQTPLKSDLHLTTSLTHSGRRAGVPVTASTAILSSKLSRVAEAIGPTWPGCVVKLVFVGPSCSGGNMATDADDEQTDRSRREDENAQGRRKCLDGLSWYAPADGGWRKRCQQQQLLGRCRCRHWTSYFPTTTPLSAYRPRGTPEDFFLCSFFLCLYLLSPLLVIPPLPPPLKWAPYSNFSFFSRTSSRKQTIPAATSAAAWFPRCCRWCHCYKKQAAFSASRCGGYFAELKKRDKQRSQFFWRLWKGLRAPAPSDVCVSAIVCRTCGPSQRRHCLAKITLKRRRATRDSRVKGENDDDDDYDRKCQQWRIQSRKRGTW